MAFPVGWDYYTPITIQSSKVAATLSDFSFPVVLDNLGTTFWNNVENGGGDIRVTLNDGTTQVPVDVISCNTSTQKGQIRVSLSSLSGSTNTTIRIYHGKSGESLPAAGSTYGQYNAYRSEIEAAWPHEEDPSGGASAIKDRTVNAWHGTSLGGMVAGDLVTGKLENCFNFSDSLNAYYGMGNTSKPNGLKPGTPLPVNGLPISISMMVNFDATGSAARMFTNDSWSTNYYGITFEKLNTDQLHLAYGNGGIPGAGSRRSLIGNTVLSASTWYHIVGVIPATSPETTMKIYINGVDDGGTYSGVGSAFTYSSSFDTTIGSDNSNTYRMDGKIDSVKFWSGYEINSNWASTLYEAEYNNSTFFTIGSSVSTTDHLRSPIFFF